MKLLLLPRNFLVLCALFRLLAGIEGSVKAGSIEGTVTFIGEVPKSTMTDDAGRRHELLEVDSKTRGLRYVAVYVTQADGSPVPSQPRVTAARSPEKLLMDQVDYAFTPRVLAVREGEAVTFTNSDPANHNVRTTASNKTNEFNVFTGIDGKHEHKFRVEPRYHPVRLGCDIHPWMRAWIFVFDHPWFAVTDKTGQFRIADVPPGEFLFHVVQPDIAHREQQRVSVVATETVKLEIAIRRDAMKQFDTN